MFQKSNFLASWWGLFLVWGGLFLWSGGVFFSWFGVTVVSPVSAACLWSSCRPQICSNTDPLMLLTPSTSVMGDHIWWSGGPQKGTPLLGTKKRPKMAKNPKNPKKPKKPHFWPFFRKCHKNDLDFWGAWFRLSKNPKRDTRIAFDKKGKMGFFWHFGTPPKKDPPTTKKGPPKTQKKTPSKHKKRPPKP